MPWCVIKNHYRDFLVFKDTFVMMCYKKPFSRFSCLKTSYVDLLSKSITLRKIEKFESFQQHFRHFFLPLSVSPSCFPLSLLLSKEWINKPEICCPVPYHRQCCPKSSSVGNNGHSCQSLIVSNIASRFWHQWLTRICWYYRKLRTDILPTRISLNNSALIILNSEY